MNVRRTVIRALGVVLSAVFAAGCVPAGPMLSGVRGPSPGFLAEAPQADGMKDLAGIRDVSCQQARDIVQKHQGDSNFVILDFRTKEMFDESHIRGAVCHDVFLADIDDWLNTLDRERTYLIYCTLGHRSRIALEKMRGLGFANILHMNEGLSRWKQLGYETVR